MSNRQELLDLINQRITEAQTNKSEGKPKRKPATREGKNESTGPSTPEGKEKASANSLKHGYYASLEKLNPRDSEAFHHVHTGLYTSLHPDGPAETHLVEEIAMLSARLQSLEAAQFALIAGNTEGEPQKIKNPESYTDGELHDLRQPDARDVAASYERSLDTLERLTKIETHLRRAYNRSWDRLERMQKERNKLPLDVSIKRTQHRLTAEAHRTKGSVVRDQEKALRNNRPQDIPAPHPDLDETGKFKHYEKGDPLYRPKDREEDNENKKDIDPGWN